ncbi:MAG: bacterial Ig-like domain-containing protein [Streptococcaceae bacterium]|jgi:hypothetical protein|nr:bacterial Ig-like domain-containing protein [Streptococcaceae bacterium]
MVQNNLARISVKNSQNPNGTAWFARDNFIEAYDSHGDKVSANMIAVSGNVIPMRAGEYNIVYSFIDPYTHEKIRGVATITVLPKGKVVRKTGSANIPFAQNGKSK